MTIRLMIIDDHDLVRAGLVQFFAMQNDFEVVAEAANCKELLGKLRMTQVDMLLLDLTMPGVDGKDMITLVRTFYPDLKILVLSAHDEVRIVLGALRAGASGFVSKSCSPQALLEAVKEVVATGKYIPRDMAERLEYAAASMPPNGTDAALESVDGVVRLNGKTIDEWKEDCEAFYQEKAVKEKTIGELDSKNIALENRVFDLEEKIRHTE